MTSLIPFWLLEKHYSLQYISTDHHNLRDQPHICNYPATLYAAIRAAHRVQTEKTLVIRAERSAKCKFSPVVPTRRTLQMALRPPTWPARKWDKGALFRKQCGLHTLPRRSEMRLRFRRH